MSQGHGADGIAWRDWSEDAFAASRSQDKPVLLTLGATWCHWCHVMDETAYSDPRVIDLVNARFIPVRVDVDQRPDISLRYNQGTYPSVAFLTPDGELLAGLPYTPADEMAAVLERISSGESVAELSSPAAKAEPSTNSGTNASVDAVLGRLRDLYDEEFGGFALEPKQPPWEALQFLLAQHQLTGDRKLLAMVETTLQGMWHGIYDRKDQGFFRYAVSRDWKVPHYEKMLVTNANLAMVYLEALQATRKAIYRTAVEGILDYLVTTLFSAEDGLFFASQDADEPFYLGSWESRDNRRPPPVDHTLYAGWNALAARTLIQAGDVLNRASHVRLGADILDTLWQGSWTSAHGLSRRAVETNGTASTLIDQVYFLRAWLARYQSTGRMEHLTRAAEVANSTERIFGSPGGGCYDTAAPQSFEAGFLRREQPVLDNSCWAESLLILSHLTGDAAYADRAAVTLQIFEAVVPGKELPGRSRLAPHGRGRGGAVPACGISVGTSQELADPWTGQHGAGGRLVRPVISSAAPGGPADPCAAQGGAAAGHRTGRRAHPRAGVPGAPGRGSLRVHGRAMPCADHHGRRRSGNGPLPPVGHGVMPHAYPVRHREE